MLPSRVGLWGAAGQKFIQNVRLKHGAELSTGYREAEGGRRGCADREKRDVPLQEHRCCLSLQFVYYGRWQVECKRLGTR